MHPDTLIISTTTVEYDPASSVAPQPEVEIVSATTVEYTPPPSTGGQPNLVITSFIITEVEPTSPVYDALGETELRITTSGKAEVETEPVPVPVSIDFHDQDIVKVIMPTPTVFDQFGRPIG